MTTNTAPTPDAGRAASPIAVLSTPMVQDRPNLPALPSGVSSDLKVQGANPAPASPHPREPGIYFGLPEAEYHADPSLGSTDLKRLLRSPTDYWWASWMNPKRKPEDYDTPAKKQGRALHKLVLEGRAAFHKAYTPEPQPADWPEALRTAEDLKRVLREKGEKLTGDKAELVKRVKGLIATKVLGEDTILWDDVLGHHQAMVERDGLELLKPDVFAEVETAGHMVAMNPHLANAFIGGVSEVSVFWRDADGLPCKARFDYLKPRTIPDLKKCANKAEMPFPDACRTAFFGYRYDIQVAHYLEEGYPAFLEHADAGRIFGKCPLPDGFAALMAPPQAMTFTLVFHQTSGAPVTEGAEIASGSPLLAEARADVALAKKRYRDCLGLYGADLWVSDGPIRQWEPKELPYRFRVAAELAEAA